MACNSTCLQQCNLLSILAFSVCCIPIFQIYVLNCILVFQYALHLALVGAGAGNGNLRAHIVPRFSTLHDWRLATKHDATPTVGISRRAMLLR